MAAIVFGVWPAVQIPHACWWYRYNTVVVPQQPIHTPLPILYMSTIISFCMGCYFESDTVRLGWLNGCLQRNVNMRIVAKKNKNIVMEVMQFILESLSRGMVRFLNTECEAAGEGKCDCF